MCGITCIVRKNKGNISQLLIQSILQLQNRGYDSIGFGTLYEEKFYEKKVLDYNANLFDLVNEDDTFQKTSIAIGHTRWATHGGVSISNAHPHISFRKKVLLVHNGIIENYKDLKDELTKKKYEFYSETDSEVICNLLEENLINDLNTCNDDNFNEIQAIEKTMQCLEGTFGIACIFLHEPEKIYLFRNGSPLIIGENENYLMATSEISGFANQMKSYFTLENNKIAVLDKTKIYFHECEPINSKITTDAATCLTCDPYAHWTLKEIMEQKDSLNRVLNYGGRLINDKVKLGGIENMIRNFQINVDAHNHLIILGCGTSLYAGQCGLNYFKHLKCFSSYQCIDGAEFTQDDIPNFGNSYIIFCSQSGETFDLLRCIDICKKINCITIGVINVVDSIIAKQVDCGIYLNAGREVAVASTKSFTSMLMALKLLSLWFYNLIIKNNHISESIIKNIRLIPLHVSNNTNIDIIKYIEPLNSESLFLLGKGKMEALAKEGALKIKELCYIHAEGYSGSALKHGPFALLKKGSPVILLIDSKNKNKMKNAYEEVSARGAYSLIITNLKENIGPNQIYVECNDDYEEFSYSIILQKIAYYLSIHRNINPDKPRNLAKVVTVE